MMCLMDGTAMHQVKMYDGDYGLAFIWMTVGGMIGPLVSGALIEDSTDPDSKKLTWLYHFKALITIHFLMTTNKEICKIYYNLVS